MTHQNQFGMFIHFGIYAIPAVHEQVFGRYRMDRTEYEQLAERFNPSQFSAKEWVELAKSAGMKYICFTTKHHDGFCMWDTKETDYKITNTPFGRDLLKELAEECKKQGMKLSLYYSVPDWHHPDAYNALSTHQLAAVIREDSDFSRYVEYVKKQITELLTNYGDIYAFWWDIPPKRYDPSLNELIRKLQPGILINDRGFSEGDFSTPERDYDQMPDTMRFERMTEACNSVGSQSWGYRSNEDYHSYRYLTSAIDRVMAMGGSYLLNVGPMADGTIDEKSRALVSRVGDWYRRLGGVLEAHTAPTRTITLPKHVTHCIINEKEGKSYFHFYEGIKASGFGILEYPSTPRSVRLLNSGESLPFELCSLPEFRSEENGYCDEEILHIMNIPVDQFPDEPLVIEIEW